MRPAISSPCGARTRILILISISLSPSRTNPVFYVQYAHARIHSVLRQAEERRLDTKLEPAVLKRSTRERESDLLMKLGDFPQEIATAAEQLAPHRILNYLYDLASQFHSYYNAERVLTDDVELNCCLSLLRAVATVIKNGLALVGVSAPERM